MNKTKYAERSTHDARRNGSAIILAIVLTSLLALIGVLFLISSRVDSIATSSIADNADLTLAVDSVIAQISQDLTADVMNSGDHNNPNYYADYPDASNYWLASLEPNDAIIWPHITDLYNKLGSAAFDMNMPNTRAAVYEHGDPAGDSTSTNQYRADADGDGAPDSMWVQIPAKSSSKGKPIFAAVRIIDNSAMLNVNTGLKFDPSTSVGSTQADVNVMALSWRIGGSYDSAHETSLKTYRNPQNHSSYEKDVIWRYDSPDCNYTPFDISDELDLRYRFLIDQNDIRTRIELWSGEFAGDEVHSQPFDGSNSGHGSGVSKNWSTHARYTETAEPNYTYRHIATTYNCDRIITPAGNQMVNINTAEPNAIRDAILHGLVDANAVGDINGIAAQIAANVIDYRDDDNEVAVVKDNSGGLHFGFKRPCIYISEIAQNFYQDPGPPSTTYHSYAIELFKPYPEDPLPDSNWQIVIIDNSGTNRIISVNWSGSNAFHVFLDNDAANLIDLSSINFTDVNGNAASGTIQGANGSLSFDSNYEIELRRHVNDPCSSVYDIIVDKVIVPSAGANWLQTQIAPATKATYSFQRDISTHKPIRRLWDTGLSKTSSPSLGGVNSFVDNNDTRIIQAHPANKPFTNVGEIGQLFYNTTYDYGGTIPSGIAEPNLRINLASSDFQQIFKYLTVWPPSYVDANETRIKGRININTAPWFVIAQLPWVSFNMPNYDLARAIVDYRDNNGGFKSIGELMRVINPANDPCSIGYYANIPFTSISSVLMTPKDFFQNEDIFEKRDLIFDRISNLVTVRSDVFTAYILVRIGPNGPQKRVIAILDRTGVVPDPTSPSGYSGKVKIIAVQPVPDSR